MSDEDSDVEEGFSPIHLNSRQLAARADFVVNYGNENVTSLDEEEELEGKKKINYGG